MTWQLLLVPLVGGVTLIVPPPPHPHPTTPPPPPPHPPPPHALTRLKAGYTGFTLSSCPSIHLWRVDRIMSNLYLQQYPSDPYHICTSYQTTSRVMFVSKLKNLKFWRITPTQVMVYHWWIPCWNAGSHRQPLEQEGNPMTWLEKFWLQISLIVTKKS